MTRSALRQATNSFDAIGLRQVAPIVHGHIVFKCGSVVYTWDAGRRTTRSSDEKFKEETHAQDAPCGRKCGLHHDRSHMCRPCAHRRRQGAAADRDQVQPRGVARCAQGQGLVAVQGTGREIHQRPGQGRSLSELLALQGQGGAGGAAARLGADFGAVDLKVRPARDSGIRCVRPAVPDERRYPCARR